MWDFLELLTRIELVTSSLPTAKNAEMINNYTVTETAEIAVVKGKTRNFRQMLKVHNSLKYEWKSSLEKIENGTCFWSKKASE